MTVDPENRYRIAIGIILIAFVFLLTRVALVQVGDQESRVQANAASLVKTIQKPSRGLIYDRNGELIVFNKFVYDVNVTYQKLSPDMDTALLLDLLDIDRAYFDRNIERDWSDIRYSKFLPFRFKSRIPDTVAVRFKEYLHEFPGFSMNKEAVRGYKYSTAAHVLGYISEIDQAALDMEESPYMRGDYIGKSGVELYYEDLLRGEKGHRYELKDNLGRKVGDYLGGALNVEAISGQDLTLSIDVELQRYSEKLLKNKKGGVVALEPATGEILAMLSYPDFNLNDLSIGQDRGAKFQELFADTLKPFYDRSMMAHYPSGSIFKPLIGLIGLQENVITPYAPVFCGGGFFYKNNVWRCHAGGGNNTMESAIARSCNTYFFNIYRDLINKYGFNHPEKGLYDVHQWLSRFGLGRKLGVDLPLEGTGLNPTPAFYDDIYRNKGAWRFTYILSNAIGQGEVELTTLQMANVAAAIANRGHYIIPHVIRQIDGSSDQVDPKYFTPVKLDIDEKYFDPVINGMEGAVKNGTAHMAYIPDLQVCGKTGTSENRGKDHSVFIAFAPRDNPQIAVAVFVENGGWGSTHAAPIAGLMIEKYINGEISPQRKWIEDRMLASDLIHQPLTP